MPTTKKTSAKKPAAKKKAVPKKVTAAKAKKTSAPPKKAAAKKSPAAKSSVPKVKAAAKAKAPKAKAQEPKAKPTKPAKPVTRPSTERESLIQEIRRRLLEEKARLVADAEATRNDLPDDETYPDLGDQATAETDRSFLLRLRSRESKLIKKIDDTIDLIDKGDYGTCEECGEEIDSRRLEARPVTTYCIECKTRQEEEERLR